eukprot:1536088-Rhodomonas_salina.1
MNSAPAPAPAPAPLAFLAFLRDSGPPPAFPPWPLPTFSARPRPGSIIPARQHWSSPGDTPSAIPVCYD